MCVMEKGVRVSTGVPQDLELEETLGESNLTSSTMPCLPLLGTGHWVPQSASRSLVTGSTHEGPCARANVRCHGGKNEASDQALPSAEGKEGIFIT